VFNKKTGAKVEGEEGDKFGNVFLTKKGGAGQMGRGAGEKETDTKSGGGSGGGGEKRGIFAG
jgi:hypothetical protein